MSAWGFGQDPEQPKTTADITSSRLLDRVAVAFMLINVLLLLAGVLAFRYSHSIKAGDGHWSPTPPPYDNPYSSYFEPVL